MTEVQTDREQSQYKLVVIRRIIGDDVSIETQPVDFQVVEKLRRGEMSNYAARKLIKPRSENEALPQWSTSKFAESGIPNLGENDVFILKQERLDGKVSSTLEKPPLQAISQEEWKSIQAETAKRFGQGR